jgi:hypothetical protein
VVRPNRRCLFELARLLRWHLRHRPWRNARQVWAAPLRRDLLQRRRRRNGLRRLHRLLQSALRSVSNEWRESLSARQRVPRERRSVSQVERLLRSSRNRIARRRQRRL